LLRSNIDNLSLHGLERMITLFVPGTAIPFAEAASPLVTILMRSSE
jgi:hypothetical protein